MCADLGVLGFGGSGWVNDASQQARAEALSQMGAHLARFNSLQNLIDTNQLLYGNDKPDPKRVTRRKWWLVRKAIPLPWVRR